MEENPDYETDQKYDCDCCLKTSYVKNPQYLIQELRDDGDYLDRYIKRFRITSNPWIEYNNGKLEAIVTFVSEPGYYRFFTILNGDIYHQVLALIKDMKGELFKTWLEFDDEGKLRIAK